MTNLTDLLTELHDRPARTRPTQSQIAETLEVLAPIYDYTSLTRVDLSFIVSKGLGLSTVSDESGAIVKVRNGKRAGLIAAIDVATEQRRAIIALNEEMSSTDVTALVASQEALQGGSVEFAAFVEGTLIPRLVRYMDSLYDRATQTYRMHAVELDRCAATVVGFLTQVRHGKQWSCHMVVKARGQVKKALVGYDISAFPAQKKDAWREIVSLVFSLVCEMTAAFDTERKAVQKVTHTARKMSVPTGVVMDAMLEHAYEVLRTCSLTDTTQWREIQLAVSLATGRRSVEVFLTSVFSRVDPGTVLTLCGREYPTVPTSHLLNFTGHVKTQGSSAAYYATHPTYVVPTLLPAALVMRGVKLLQAKRAMSFGDDVNTDNHAVSVHNSVALLRFNNSFAGELSKVSSRWYEMFLEPCGVPLYVPGTNSRTFTPHRLRSLYAHCAAAWLNSCTGIYQSMFFADVLGDSRGSDDKSVAEHYEIGFQLAPTSITHID